MMGVVGSTVRRMVRKLKRLVLCGLLAFCLPLSADEVRLPEMGSSADAVWTPAERDRIGHGVLRSLRRAGKLHTDPLLGEYVAALGARLVSAADVQDQRFHFFVVDDDTINAFAAPGGYIGVHTGLILAARTEGELAAVLAHEIAHVTQQHLARAYEEAGSMSIPTLVALLGAMLVGASDSELGSAAVAGVAAGNAQRQINFTREHEKEADRIGIQVLAAAGFDAHDMPQFFERMQQASRYSGSQLPTFLRTHPVTNNRLAEAKDRASRLPLHPVPLVLDFHLAQTRVAATGAADPREAERRLNDLRQNSQGVMRTAAEYGLVVVWLRQKQWSEARRLARELQRENPDRLAFRLLTAEVESAAGQWPEALRIYAEAQRLFPGNHPLTIRHAETLLQTQQAGKARLLLQSHLRNHRPEPQVYRLAATVSGEAGYAAEAHSYLAESFYLLGHLGEALRQIELAFRQPELDRYLESRLVARKEAIEAEMRLNGNRR